MQSPSATEDAFLDSLDASQVRQIISQLEEQIGKQNEEIEDLKNEKEEMKDDQREMEMEYQRNIETLQTSLQATNIEHTQLQARFDDAKHELHELQGNENEMENAKKERHDAILELQRLEQDHIAMTQDIHVLQNENEQLRTNLKDSQSNLSKLQTTLVSMKKEKRDIESRFSKYIQDSKLREEALHIEIEDLEARMDEMNKMTDSLRQGMIVSEQEKMKMQNDFTAATMDLLTDDLNAGNGHGDRHGTMRLSAITAEDTKPSERQRTDSTFSVFSDTDQIQFASHRMASGSIAVNDESLLDEMKDRYHGRTESQLSMDSDRGHHPRHSRQLSMGASSEALLQKLRVFLSRELIGQVKTMLSEELKNIDIKDQLDGVPQKLEALLMDILKNQSEIKDGKSSLNQESLNEMFKQFEPMVTTTLSDTLTKVNESGNDSQRMKEAMDEALEDIRRKLDAPSDALKNALDDTLTEQMTALQMSIENQIESSIKTGVEISMGNKVGKDVSNIVNTEVGKPLQTIQETVEQIYDCVKSQNENMDGKNSEMIEEFGTKMEEMFKDSLKETGAMQDMMQDRMDKFMQLFRKEVIPEFEAVFAQMDLNKTRNKAIDSDSSTSSDNEDEKYDENRNEYEAKIIVLEDRILELLKELKQLKCELRDAATSKTSSLLRLQNLIDHLRFDNRVLQQQLDRYRLKDAIYNEQASAKTSWMGSMFSGFGGFGQKVIHVNVSNMEIGNVQQASTAAAEYTANAAVNVVARAVNAGVNDQNVST